MSSFDFILGNRYRLLSPLGEGGMASVYAAQDERLGRRVAVKVLAESLLKDPDFVKRFQAEAEAAANLTHPNIVPVYDVGQDGERHFIVMELVEGRNLKDLIADRGTLPIDQSVGIICQVLDGLAYAHAHGLIHRDIKPQNILVNREGIAKLADFGIAKAADNSSATQTAVILGSAHYFSPEQAQGDRVTAQSDIYSVGVVLYEICVGAVPFEGSNLLSVAAQHLHDDPAHPSSVNPAIPSALSRVILTALAKEPAARFESASAMRAALRELPAATPAEINLAATQRIEPTPAREEPLLRAPNVTRARPAGLRYALWALAIALVALAVNRSSMFLPASTPNWAMSVLPTASAIIGGLAVLIFVLGIVERARCRYTVDDHAVTVEVGILGHHRDAIPLPAIINLQLHQSPIARMFNIGTIVLTTVQIPGQGPVALSLKDVAHASDIYDTILRRIGGGRRLKYEADWAEESGVET
ncbi:MAG TPA: protein kinase [Chloroflexota bacterium]|nr:protein kinase [Chloroflexota bacterium]